MTTVATTSNPPLLTIDASVLIALCSKESDKHAIDEQELIMYAQAGYQFHAPGVIVAETLFVLCKKLQNHSLSAPDHAAAIADLRTYMGMIQPPPNGEGSLVARAEQIRDGYSCRHTADAIYLALTEELSAGGGGDLDFRCRDGESGEGQCAFGQGPGARSLDRASHTNSPAVDTLTCNGNERAVARPFIPGSRAPSRIGIEARFGVGKRGGSGGSGTGRGGIRRGRRETLPERGTGAP